MRMRIRDPGFEIILSLDLESGLEKFEPGIRDENPGSATLPGLSNLFKNDVINILQYGWAVGTFTIQ
jgi:hypothetical protein